MTKSNISSKITTWTIVIILFLFLSFWNASINNNNCGDSQILIDGSCCVPNFDFGLPLCQEQVDNAYQQLEKADFFQDYSQIQRVQISEDFNIETPEGYYMVKNLSPKLPLILLGLGENEEDYLMITFGIIQDTGYNSLEDFYLALQQYSSVDYITSSGDYLKETQQYSLPRFDSLQVTRNPGSLQYLLFNVSNQYTFKSNALIRSQNNYLIIGYESNNKTLFDYFHYEFENIINSIESSK